MICCGRAVPPHGTTPRKTAIAGAADPAEQRALELIREGRSNAEIAVALGVSPERSFVPGELATGTVVTAVNGRVIAIDYGCVAPPAEVLAGLDGTVIVSRL